MILPAGCDALAVYLIVAQIGGTLDVGAGPLGVTGTMAIMIPWIAAQWEEYHSGLMLYSNGTVGITEVSALRPRATRRTSWMSDLVDDASLCRT